MPLVAAVLVLVLVAAVVTWWPRDGEAPLPLPVPPGDCDPAAVESAGAADGRLTIGTLFPQTGTELGAIERQLTAAAELAMADIGRAGGVPGFALTPLGPGTAQDEGPPGSGTACRSVGQLLAGGVDAVVGPFASADSLAILPRTTAAGAVVVSPASTSVDLSSAEDRGLFFRTIPADTLQGRVVADLVAAEGRRDVVIVARADSYGRGLAAEVGRRLDVRGVGHRTVEYTPDGSTTDFGPVLDELTADAADGIVLVGFGELAGLVPVLIDDRFVASAAQLYGTDGFLHNTFAGRAAPGRVEILEGLRGTVPYAEFAFNERLKLEKSDYGLQDLTYAAQSYDAVVVVALAAAAARSDRADQMAPQLIAVTRDGTRCTTYGECLGLLRQNVDIDYDGVSGPLEFSSLGEPCEGTFLLSAFDRSGYLQAFGSGSATDPC